MSRWSRGVTAALLFGQVLMWAQIRSGTLVGKVQDASGANVPEATVVIREVNTNQSYSLSTSATGEYAQPYLAAGSYEVTARKEGFTPVTQRGLTLATAQTLRADIVLQIGQVTNEVTVVGTPTAELQTESSRVTNAVSADTIAALPNITNNALNYATLQQGVVARAGMGETQSINSFGVGTEGRRTFADFQISGGTAFSNDIQMDGVSVMASAWNEVSILPITDGIQEVRTTINNMSAEYGRSQGTVIISTKSGTNEVHGSAGYHMRNEALNANSFANNAAQPYVSRPPFKNHSFSATVGGPVIVPGVYQGKDRTFFFASYEGFRFKQAADYLLTVPTAAERAGDFSQSRSLVGGSFVPVSIYDPFNVTTVSSSQYRRQAFPNGVIPSSRLNANMVRLLSEYPQPNRAPDDPTGVNNFYNRMQRTLDRDAVNTRIDHRQGMHSFYGTFGNNFGTINSPNGWGDGTRNFAPGSSAAINQDRNYYASIGDTWILNPTVVADMRLGLTRVAADNRAPTFDGVDYTQWGISSDWYGAIGLAGALPEVTSAGGGFSKITALNNTGYAGKKERQTNWNLVGSVTKIAGRWTHRSGAEFRNYLGNYLDARGSFNMVSSNSYTAGNLIGPLANTIDTVTADKSGSGLASMLLGAGSVAAGENAVPLALSAKYFAVYQQSDWRATDRLTINLGLRWDLQPGPTERYNRLSSFSYRGSTMGTPGRLMFPGSNGLGRNLYAASYGDFGPRLGLAYRARSSWVIRSGFGVNYLPSNTGYFGGPFYYGVQNFAPKLSDPNVTLQYGNAPAGAIIAPYNQVETLLPAIGANPNAPQYYGAGGNEPRFDYDSMKNGKVLQWNFFVEKKTAGGLISVGYAGTHGYRLQWGRQAVNHDQLLPVSLRQTWRTAYINSNGVNPGTQLSANPYQPDLTNLIPYNGSLGSATMTNAALASPYPFFTSNAAGEPIGYSNYNALMLQYTRNLSHGLTFNAHYTWSKALDMVFSEAQDNNFRENGAAAFNLIDRSNNRNTYAISANDIPQRFVATWSWAAPFGKGKTFDAGNRMVNAVIGGWNVGGVLIAQSGLPQQGFNGATGSLTGLSDRVPGVDVEVPKELQRWYTGATTAERTVKLPSGRQIVVCRYCFLKYSSDAFSGRTVQFPNGNIGNDIYWYGNAALRYDDIRIPGRVNVDLSVRKEFRLRERVSAEFSAEASNLLNNWQFKPSAKSAVTGTTGGTFTNLSATQKSQGIQPGMLQNDAFGTYGMAGAYDPRQVELRLRIRF